MSAPLDPDRSVYSHDDGWADLTVPQKAIALALLALAVFFMTAGFATLIDGLAHADMEHSIERRQTWH